MNCYVGDKSRAFLWQQGKAIDLGTLPGDRNSSAVAINARGQLVGNSDSGYIPVGIHDSFLRTHAFLWQHGELIPLATPSPRWKWSEVTDLNDRGQAVGVYSSQKDPFGSHAVLWQRGRVTNLGAGDRRFERSWAAAINERGQIVGYVERPYAAGSVAVRWENGALSKLGPRPTAKATGVTGEALAVNEPGQVLGDTGFGGSGGFLWENGKTTALRKLNVAGINDRGQIVGTGGDFYHDNFHARIWQQGKVTDLGTTPGARQSAAVAINNRGQVIGQSGDWVNSNAEWFHAFVWQNGTMTDLGTLGGKTSSAVAINDRNQILGSSGTGRGQEHAVLWTLRNG
jgi:probable HAF family extracellular repeat protein